MTVAREWFGLRKDEPPDLERLIRQVRPAEDFLNLCAVPGQKRLSIAGRLVEVTSHQVPGTLSVDVSHHAQCGIAGELDHARADSSTAQDHLRFWRRTFRRASIWKTTLYSILLNVSHLVPSDIWRSKPGMQRTGSSLRTALSPAAHHRCTRVAHSQFGGLTDSLCLAAETALSDSRCTSIGSNFRCLIWKFTPVKSYLGLPLIAGDELVGTLEVGHLTPGVLGQADLDLVQLVSSQAAYSIRNAACVCR